MSGDSQGKFRDEILSVMLGYFQREEVTAIEAAVACMGAAAAALAIIADDAARSEAAMFITEALPRHANKRRAEIMSGRFDLALELRRQ